MTHFIGIVSAKGGVGKTTTAINLSTALAAYGRSVVAVDADLSAPNMSVQLGLPRLPSSIHDVLSGKLGIRNSVFRHSSGLNIVPGSIAYENKGNFDYLKLASVVSQLKGFSEAVIVDSSPGLGLDAESTIKAVDSVIIVTTPDMISVTDARKTVRLAKENGKRVLGAVLNKSRNDKYDMEIGSIEAYMEAPVIGIIPEDHRVRASQVFGNPVVFSHPDAPSTDAYKALAAKLIGNK